MAVSFYLTLFAILYLGVIPMKVIDAITAGRILRPGTNFTDDIIMEWLTTLDQELLTQSGEKVLRIYTDKNNDELFLPEPFSDAYKWYISAQMYLYDRDMDSYNNMILLFNTIIETFWRHNVTSRELNNEAVINIW